MKNIESEYKEFMNSTNDERIKKLKSFMEFKDKYGKTLLMYDAEKGTGQLTKFFINNYEDAELETKEFEEFVAAKDNEGRSALTYSIKSQNSTIRELVSLFATNTNRVSKDYEKEVMQVTDNRGRTPLIYAVHFGKDSYDTKAMVGYSDVNAKDNEGKTALDYALASGRAEMIEELNRAGGKFFLGKDKGYTIGDVEQTMENFKGSPEGLAKVIQASGKRDKYLKTILNTKNTNNEDKKLVNHVLDNKKQDYSDLENIKLAFDNNKTTDDYKNRTKRNLRKKQAELGREIRKDHLVRLTNALGITKKKVGNRAELIAEQEKIGEVLRSGGMTMAGKIIDATYKAVGKKPRLGQGR